MDTRDAIQEARNRASTSSKIAPGAAAAVAKIIDYGKFPLRAKEKGSMTAKRNRSPSRSRRSSSSGTTITITNIVGRTPENGSAKVTK